MHTDALAAIEQPPQMKAGQRVIRMLPNKGCEGWHCRDVVGLQFGKGFGILLRRRRLEYRRQQWLVGAKRLTPPAQNEIADWPPAEIFRPSATVALTQMRVPRNLLAASRRAAVLIVSP